MIIEENLSDNYNGAITGRQNRKETANFTVVNKTTATKKIAIFPGNLRTARPLIPVDNAGTLEVPVIGGAQVQAVPAGTLPFMAYDSPEALQRYAAVDVVLDKGVNGVLYDEDGTKQITVTEGTPIRELVSHICQAPATLERIRFNANSREAVDKLYIIEMNPFGTDIKKRTIELGDYIKETASQDGLVDIILSDVLGEDVQLDENTLLLLDLPGTVSTPAGATDAKLKVTYWFKDFVKQAAVADVLKKSGF